MCDFGTVDDEQSEDARTERWKEGDGVVSHLLVFEEFDGTELASTLEVGHKFGELDVSAESRDQTGERWQRVDGGVVDVGVSFEVEVL